MRRHLQDDRLTTEPASLKEIKNHPQSVCFGCIHLMENCSAFAWKTIHTVKKKTKLGNKNAVIACTEHKKLK